MIVGIGCDIVNHEISKNLNWNTDTRVLCRIFSQREIEIYLLKKEMRFLTGRFAAKEAVLKCLGTGMRDGLALTDIEILQSKEGRPILDLLGQVKWLSDKMRIVSWYVSITHSDKQSMAFVIAER